MLAPVALYPDSLLSQIFMASTYPLEVVQAARWSKANASLVGDQAVWAVEQQDWDPSVKSLVAFPQILSLLDQRLDWMQRLGDAFLSQQQQVMDTVQHLRQRAQEAGYLRSNDRVSVETQGESFAIQPANPQVVYVPYYDPNIVYGNWWWPDYPPVFWGPWPGYYATAGFSTGYFWDVGIVLGGGFFFGDCDWRHRRVTVAQFNNYYYRSGRHAGDGSADRWRHNPWHRHGVAYRDPELSHQFRDANTRVDARTDVAGSSVGTIVQQGMPPAHPNRSGAPEPRTRQLDHAHARAENGFRPELPDTRQPDYRDLPLRPNATAPGGNANSPGISRGDLRHFPAVAIPNPVVVGPPSHRSESAGRGATAHDFGVQGSFASSGYASSPPVRAQSSGSDWQSSGRGYTGHPSGGWSGGGRSHR
jgi:hypothetical protein